MSTNYLPFDADDPWVKLFQEINTKYNAGAPFTGNTIYGMSVAYTFAEALTQAGKNPTRAGILEALESGKVKSNGIVPGTFSADDHEAFGGAGIVTVSEGVQATWTGSSSPPTRPAARSAPTPAPASPLPASGIPAAAN